MNKQSFLEVGWCCFFLFLSLIWAFIVCYTTCHFKLCNCLTLPRLNEILTLRARAHSGALNREECVFVWFFSLTHTCWEQSIITAHKLWKARFWNYTPLCIGWKHLHCFVLEWIFHKNASGRLEAGIHATRKMFVPCEHTTLLPHATRFCSVNKKPKTSTSYCILIMLTLQAFPCSNHDFALTYLTNYLTKIRLIKGILAVFCSSKVLDSFRALYAGSANINFWLACKINLLQT